jgi:plasmid stabilization system protein ParE
MSYTIRFRPEVVSDLEDAARWYDEQRVGLGGEFLQECRATLDRIVQQPERAAADEGGIRSIRLHRFPYVAHYRVEGATIVVFAIMFGGRDPSAWEDRV